MVSIIRSEKLKKYLLITNIWVLFATFVIICAKFYLADVYYAKSQELLRLRKFSDSLIFIDKAIQNNPYEPSYFRGRAKTLVYGLVFVDKNERMYLKERALSDLRYSYKLNPYNLVTLRNSVPLYYFLSIYNIDAPVSEENVDDTYLTLAKSFFDEMKNRYKNDLGVLLLVAKYEKKLGLTNDFSSTSEKIRNLRPDILNWYNFDE